MFLCDGSLEYWKDAVIVASGLLRAGGLFDRSLIFPSFAFSIETCILHLR